MPDRLRVPAVMVPYFAQFLLVCAVMIAWTALLEKGAGWSEVSGSPLGNVGFQVANAAAVGAIELMLGLAVQRFVPSQVTARWIWVLPLSVLSLSITWDLVALGAGPGIVSYFFCAHPGRDEACAARDLFTYPAWSCAWYSVGAAFAARKAA